MTSHLITRWYLICWCCIWSEQLVLCVSCSTVSVVAQRLKCYLHTHQHLQWILQNSNVWKWNVGFYILCSDDRSCDLHPSVLILNQFTTLSCFYLLINLFLYNPVVKWLFVITFVYLQLPWHSREEDTWWRWEFNGWCFLISTKELDKLKFWSCDDVKSLFEFNPSSCFRLSQASNMVSVCLMLCGIRATWRKWFSARPPSSLSWRTVAQRSSATPASPSMRRSIWTKLSSHWRSEVTTFRFCPVSVLLSFFFIFSFFVSVLFISFCFLSSLVQNQRKSDLFSWIVFIYRSTSYEVLYISWTLRGWS